MKNYLDLCKEVKNNRDVYDAYDHSLSEMKELRDELSLKIKRQEPGEDGVVGESVDVILCMLDIISMENPNMTMEELDSIMFAKYNKWKKKYGDN